MRIGEVTFAVPIASVRGVGRIQREVLARGETTYRYGNEEYVLHDLGKLLGHAPAEHDRRRDAYEYAAADVLLPHPVYAAQAWVAVVEPGPRTADLVRELVVHARDLALARLRRRADRGA